MRTLHMQREKTNINDRGEVKSYQEKGGVTKTTLRYNFAKKSANNYEDGRDSEFFSEIMF